MANILSFRQAAKPWVRYGKMSAFRFLGIDLLTAINIFLTGLNMIFVFQTYRLVRIVEKKKVPIISIILSDIPPYIGTISKSKLTLKNIGSISTSEDPDVILRYSWMPGIELKFKYSSKGFSLAPNEEITWKFKVEENLPSNSSIYVIVKDKKFGHWELTEQIS